LAPPTLLDDWSLNRIPYTNRFKDGGLFTNGIMGEKYLINIVEKENPAN
jgi:hypothetical protein